MADACAVSAATLPGPAYSHRPGNSGAATSDIRVHDHGEWLRFVTAWRCCFGRVSASLCWVPSSGQASSGHGTGGRAFLGVDVSYLPSQPPGLGPAIGDGRRKILTRCRIGAPPFVEEVEGVH